ncbi:peptidoglycan-binding protein LysM [Tenacibaculum todarodis]|uniref:Peptidoglycan-binding protein LysM n=1 Tax=Tenacibaculum todarodis TaxID=1850252 RepID=A0A1L3JGB8_9FLAO|nr:peptidoglycan-binding protein LysM [Tenacibaculum todarodis]
MAKQKQLVIRNLILILVFIGLTNFTTTNPKESKTINKATVTNTNSVVIPLLQKDFIGFKEALAFKESQGKYNAVNSLGYLGKYQFGKTTLLRFRIYNTKAFLNTPELQEKAFIALCKVNKYILRKDIKRSVGKTINGIKITESGILAAAHLSGAGNVKKYLRSKGVNKFSDAYGATIESYLNKFKGYDVSVIQANKKATV